jgi:hypothetical protein
MPEQARAAPAAASRSLPEASWRHGVAAHVAAPAPVRRGVVVTVVAVQAALQAVAAARPC